MLIRLQTKIGHVAKHACFSVLKKSIEPFLRFSQKRSIKKLPENYYANDLRKTSRSRDREHQFQQNFVGVK